MHIFGLILLSGNTNTQKKDRGNANTQKKESIYLFHAFLRTVNFDFVYLFGGCFYSFILIIDGGFNDMGEKEGKRDGVSLAFGIGPSAGGLHDGLLVQW